MFTTVDNAADTNQIARRIFFYLITNGYHAPYNFMARHAGINRPRPLGTDLFAMFTTVDNSADTKQIARRIFFYLITKGYHAPYNFMARHAGINRPRPLGTDLVDIGMADATVSDLNFDIMRSQFTPGDIHRFKRLFSGICTNSFDLHCVYA